MKSGVLRLSSLSLVAVVALAGCSGGDNGKTDAKKSASPQTSSSQSRMDESSSGVSSEPVDPLTEPGSSLELGESARFIWKATAKVTGEAEVSVTRIDKASVKAFSGFKLTDELKKSTPYFVHLKVKNAGKKNLGGFEPPIFLDNGSSILYPAAHINNFGPCAKRELPVKFQAGKSAKLCMVFLAPADTKLHTVALRPDESKEQIDWTGKITKPGAAQKG